MKTVFLLLTLMCSFFTTLLEAQTIVGSNDTTIVQGNPAQLNAQLINGSYGTSSYTFEQYAYSPEPYTGGTQDQFLDGDDWVEGPFNKGFDFCFFNQTFPQFWVSINGLIGFQDNPHTFVAVLIPDAQATTPKNCIMAPWQDWVTGWGPNSVVYYYVSGTSPNRKLVVYWNNANMFGCPTMFGKFQIVLNEQSSIIENQFTTKHIHFRIFIT
jgi:hypothetical protein